jgi:hypothetical protein
MTTYLGRDDILGASDLEYTEVNVPQWNGKVRIRSLTAEEKDEFEQTLMNSSFDEVDDKGTLKSNRNIKEIRAKLFVLCVVDDDGQRLFKDSDIQKVQKKSGQAIQAVWEVASVFNGLGEKVQSDVAKN